jgi:RNase H-like domain found in reverse transcriptase
MKMGRKRAGGIWKVERGNAKDSSISIARSKNHWVETDCLDFARRVVLLQKEEEERHPVAFLSKKLNKHEVNYFTYEKELFGLVEALRTWRYLLLRKYFEVFTYHKTIINLIEQKNLRGRQAWWAELLSEFDVRIMYKKEI